MRFLDRMRMCFGNLWRRKLRTFLTVLGVIIGTTSIVSMLSLGIGMKRVMMEQASGSGAINEIQIMANDEEKKEGLLFESKLEEFAALEHVDKVEPVLEANLVIKQGKYEGYMTVRGVSPQYMERIKLGEGEYPKDEGTELQLFSGNQISGNFYNPHESGTGEYVEPDIDLMNKPYRMEINYEVATGKKSEDGMEITESRTDRVRSKITGVMAGGEDSYSEYSYYLYANIDALKKFYQKKFPHQKIPGQPIMKNGRPYKEWAYSSVLITCDSSENVEELTKTINDMGYQAMNNKEWLDSAAKQSQTIEIVLGGIGMISLIVAAIGIANTMMMSTYERTKEIGVMKVLGCDMRDIRKLFLSEAATIGFLGGVIGNGFTFLCSSLLNKYAGPALEMADNAQISYIPFWLPIAALAFSALVGVLAGFFPARRAMKLSPLAAIRTE